MSKRNPKPAPPPSDPEFEKWLATQGTYQKLDPYTLALNAWRKAQEAQMKRDFNIAFAEDAVAAWEIRGAFDKRRGIVRVPGFRTKAT